MSVSASLPAPVHKQKTVLYLNYSNTGFFLHRMLCSFCKGAPFVFEANTACKPLFTDCIIIYMPYMMGILDLVNIDTAPTFIIESKNNMLFLPGMLLF